MNWRRGILFSSLAFVLTVLAGCGDDSLGPQNDIVAEVSDLELLQESEVVEDFVVAVEEVMDEETDGGGHEEARRLLRRARELRRQAAIAIRNGNLAEARRLLAEARRLTIRAILLIRGEDAFPDLLDRVCEVIARAEEALAEDPNEHAQEVLTEAIELKGMAESAFAAGNVEEALRLLFRARELAMSSIIIVRIDDIANNFLTRVDELIVEVGGLLAADPNDRAQALFDRAVELRDRAEAEINAGNHRQAIRILERAGELLKRAKRILNASQSDG